MNTQNYNMGRCIFVTIGDSKLHLFDFHRRIVPTYIMIVSHIGILILIKR